VPKTPSKRKKSHALELAPGPRTRSGWSAFSQFAALVKQKALTAIRHVIERQPSQIRRNPFIAPPPPAGERRGMLKGAPMTTMSPAQLRATAAAFALGFGAILAFAGAASADPKVLATVDGSPITADDLNDAMTDIGPGLPQKLEGAARQKYVLDYLIDLKLAAKKAQAENLDQTPEFARKLAYYRDKLSMEELLGSVAKAATTDEAEHKAYDEAAKAEPPQEEIHARHILVPTEDEAKAALARIKAGEDFAKVATELSKDPSGEGGDLGWFTKDRMVPEFSEAAFKLKKGEVSDPVKTQFGWHIIKVEDVRTKSFPPFEQVKDQAARYVAQKAESETITQLHNAAKIQLFDADGKPIPAQPEAAPDKGGNDAQGKDASPSVEKPKTP
jgi:peptidyl-prolyl cis-trans isomerase C